MNGLNRTIASLSSIKRNLLESNIQQKAIGDRHLSYWQKQLSEPLPILALPTDYPRSPIQTDRTAKHTLPIDNLLGDAIEDLSRSSDVTLFVLLLAAFQTLLYRYTGETDLLVGCPIFTRDRVETQFLIGVFTNTLIFRTQLDPEMDFSELLGRVRQVSVDAYAHQELPVEQLIEELKLERNLSHSLLFQVMFQVRNLPDRDFVVSEIDLAEFNGAPQIAASDLALDVTVGDTGLTCTFTYNTDLFAARTIERMAGHFHTLLTGIVADPYQQISRLPLLTAAELQQILREWNNSESADLEYRCIDRLFEAQVEQTPAQIAVVFAGGELTYRELNNRANQLARYLQSLGLGADKLVGISVDRSLEMVVGLLGILKAGAAYVPLDPAYPSDRLAYMVADADISILLTQDKWISRLPDCQAQIICLDSDWEKIDLCSPENLAGSNLGEDLAYIIYTSGSTGQPKGVMISHQAVSCFVRTAISAYRIAANDRLLQFASINFDAAVEEIYPCLLTGATLVLRTDEMLAGVRTFFQACDDLAISVLNLPTAYWHQLTTELVERDVSLPKALRLTIVGGEKILPAAVNDWLEYLAQQGKSDRLQILNTYGPTETTVTATIYPIPALSNTPLGEIPIGRPLERVRAYILDRHQQLVPIGVPGELHIGGDCLALGYLNQPELTIEKFIPDPFGGVGDRRSRLYKTGDLARYLPDGNIEYLGRIDNQVKIRGFRIELGEIESVLSQHPDVLNAVAIAREDASGNKRLVAYVVAQNPVTLTPAKLRQFLNQKLPEYTIPSVFVVLDKFPLTPNGKIDRRALPVTDLTARIDTETSYLAPKNALEARLMAIWIEVLGIEKLGVGDNFFELGGHSLLAINIFRKIERQWGQNLPLTTILQYPTIAELATVIAPIATDLERANRQLPEWKSLVKIERGSSIEPPLFFIHDLSGGVLLYRQIAEWMRSDRTIYGLQPRGLDGRTPPIESISEMAANYIEEILQVQPEGSYHLIGYSFGGLVAFEIARQLQLQGREVGLLAIIDISAPKLLGAVDREILPPDQSHRNYLWLASCLSLNPYQQIDDIRDRLRFHLTMGKLRLPYRFYLRYIKRALSELGSLDIYRTNELAFDNYVAPSSYPGRVTLFYSDREVPSLAVDPMLNWDKLATGGVELHYIRGSNHDTIVRVPYINVLSDKLISVLDRL
jgi:amino acid adenylation domain-containing protein